MKKIQNQSVGLFNCKSTGVAALISLLWLCSLNSSFGYVSIETVGGSTSVCDSSVSVQGNAGCDNPEGYPVVTVSNSGCPGDSYEPPVNASWDYYDGAWEGTWGPEGVDLVKGVNVIVASEAECGGSSSITVTSSGGSGVGWSRVFVLWTPCVGSSVKITWALTCVCLPKDINGGYGYKEYESTDESYAQKACYDPILDPKPSDATIDNYGTYTSPDHWTASCPHNPCGASFNLYRHIYDPLNNDQDVTAETVSMAVLYLYDGTHNMISGGGVSKIWP